MQRLSPPADVLEIAQTLEAAGFETWFVGGAVRDALLGIPDLDWDLATAAPPGDVRRLFRRTVPHGIEFGTVGVIDRRGRMHEVTTFRRDVATDGRHAVVEFGGSVDEDLARRDFTINAIAYAPARGLHDPYGGQADLERRVVRAVGDPRQRMTEDRLRALRAIRFAARFGFGIEPATWDAIVESAPHLGRLSAERVQQEIEKTMRQVPRPGEAFRLWRDSRAFATLLPPLAAMSDVALATLDCLPVPVGARASQRLTLRLAALFLDLDPARIEPALRALRFSRDRIGWMAGLVRSWHSVGPAIERALGAGPPSAADVRRWASRVGRTRVAGLVRLAAARWAARRAAGNAVAPAGAIRALYRRIVRSAFSDPLAIADLALDGDDLIALGVPAGPRIRQILEALLERVLEDPSLNTRAALEPLARELMDR